MKYDWETEAKILKMAKAICNTWEENTAGCCMDETMFDKDPCNNVNCRIYPIAIKVLEKLEEIMK